MKYYPIGTIVKLVDGNRPLMIYGRKQINADTGAVWDYLACLYPEGNIDEKTNIFFQQEEIDTVYHLGMDSKQEEKMQEILNKI